MENTIQSILENKFDTSEYRIWIAIRQRCNNPNNTAYSYYGGRGIKVCERWDDFQNFLEDMGPRPSKKHSIDRKNNNGNYEPSNCRWATKKEQNRNMRNNIILTYNGKSQCIADWADKIGIPARTISERLLQGMNLDKVLSKNKLERHDSFLITYNDITKNLTEWSKETGINRATIKQRIKNGWSVKDALYKKPRKLTLNRKI